MRKLSSSILVFILLAGFAWNSHAAEDLSALRGVLARIIPGEQPDSIQATPIDGFYEVTYGSDLFYISADGRYVFQGDLVDLKTHANLSEIKRSEGRLRVIDAIASDSAIVFSPEKVRYVVNVFTDVDCHYCRMLHKEIDSYLEQGIEIRYLAYPRSGVNTKSYYKAVSVWCSEDRKAALTFAKSGGKMGSKTCNNPVQEHMIRAGQVGLTGTPTLVLPDGSIIAGYVPADQLIRILDERIGVASGEKERSEEKTG